MLIDLFKNLGFSFEPGIDLYQWISKRARASEPFFFWYHYLDSHLPYKPKRTLATFWQMWPSLVRTNRARREQVRELPVIPKGLIEFPDSDREWDRRHFIRAALEIFDSWFGQFWSYFTASGLHENTILIVTADHGEELLERGNVGQRVHHARGSPS